MVPTSRDPRFLSACLSDTDKQAKLHGYPTQSLLGPENLPNLHAPLSRTLQ